MTKQYWLLYLWAEGRTQPVQDEYRSSQYLNRRRYYSFSNKQTMNLREQEQFYQMMTRLKANTRAASSPEAEAETMITEGHDGIIVTRPLKKVEYISQPIPKTSEQQAQVWNLTKDGPVLQSKAASVTGINKAKGIGDFIRSNGRI